MREGEDGSPQKSLLVLPVRTGERKRERAKCWVGLEGSASKKLK